MSSSNRLLARLSPGDLQVLMPHLTPCDLPLRKLLEARNRRIDYLYFVEQGFASVVVGNSNLRDAEVGIIGREGVTGLAVILGTDRAPHETYMQSAGRGQRISAANLRLAMDKSATLRAMLSLYVQAFVVQMSYTALAYGRNTINERLARWLLMAHDRIEDDEVVLTHELLAIMLGVHRPGVTTALNLLEAQGLIEPKRGVISILDRDGLVAASNGAYGPPESEFQRLFG